MGITKLVKKFGAIALSLLLCQPAFAITSTSENNQMAFEGSLTDQNGNAINLAGVTLNFYISANGCYLYGESSAAAGDSQGNIMHRFGSGTIAAGSPNSFSQNLFFGNVTGTTTFAGNNCTVTANDTRLAQVFYPAENITGTIKLGTVPFAANATMLDGKISTDFVQVSPDTNTVFTGGSSGQYLTKTASGLSWATNTLTAAQVQTALGYTPASATTSLTATEITSALGYAPVSATSLNNYLKKSNDLSDLASATVARGHLGLGNLAVKNSVNLATVDVTGILSPTNLPGFTGDVATAAGSSVTTVQSIRGYPISSTGPVSGQVLLYNGSKWVPTTVPSGIGTVTNVSSSNGDISVTNPSTTPVLTINTGSASNQILRLDSSARLPSVDASQLLNLNATQLATGIIPNARLPAFTGDVQTAVGSNTTTVTKIRGTDVATTAPVSGQVMMFTASKWTPVNLGLGSLATKSFVNLTSDVSGVLPMANGGSKWSTNLNSIYTVSTTTIGSSTAFTNVGLYLMAPTGVSSPIAASINNSASDGFGLKVNVDNSNPSLYGLKVSTFGTTNFVVLNSGNVGIGPIAASARLHIAGGTSATASLKITSGTLLFAPQAGAIEYDGMYLYHTDDAGIRRVIATGNNASSIDGVSNINTLSNLTISTPGSVIVSSTTMSTSYLNGAFIVKGGIGIAGNGNFNGIVNATGGITTSSSIIVQNNVIAGAVISPYLYGSTASGGALAIDSTSHGTKGNIILAGSGGNVGIGLVNPSYRFQIKSPGINNSVSVISASTGSSTIGNGEDSASNLYNIGYDSSGQPRWFFTTSGTNYINNDVSIGNALAIPNSKLSIHGNLSVNGNATVSKTLMLTGSTTNAPIQFLTNTMASTAIANTVEHDGSNLFYTNALSIRRRLAGGVVSGTIDNVTKVTYNGGNLTLEGNTTGAIPAITINNLGAGAIGLQINDSAVVSGSIKLSGDGGDTAVTCTASEEGKQRYNAMLKTMEFCDGSYWQGMSGITHCTSVAGGASYTLIGTPGTGSAFCISKVAEPATTYTGAVANCQARTTSRNGAHPYLCAQTNFEMACRQYTDFGANADNALPNFKLTDYWIPAGYDGSNMFILRYSTSTPNVCNVSNMVNTQVPDSSSKSYRCCYN